MAASAAVEAAAADDTHAQICLKSAASLYPGDTSSTTFASVFETTSAVVAPVWAPADHLASCSTATVLVASICYARMPIVGERKEEPLWRSELAHRVQHVLTSAQRLLGDAHDWAAAFPSCWKLAQLLSVRQSLGMAPLPQARLAAVLAAIRQPVASNLEVENLQQEVQQACIYAGWRSLEHEALFNADESKQQELPDLLLELQRNFCNPAETLFTVHRMVTSVTCLLLVLTTPPPPSGVLDCVRRYFALPTATPEWRQLCSQWFGQFEVPHDAPKSIRDLEIECCSKLSAHHKAFVQSLVDLRSQLGQLQTIGLISQAPACSSRTLTMLAGAAGPPVLTKDVHKAGRVPQLFPVDDKVVVLLMPPTASSTDLTVGLFEQLLATSQTSIMVLNSVTANIHPAVALAHDIVRHPFCPSFLYICISHLEDIVLEHVDADPEEAARETDTFIRSCLQLFRTRAMNKFDSRIAVCPFIPSDHAAARLSADRAHWGVMQAELLRLAAQDGAYKLWQRDSFSSLVSTNMQLVAESLAAEKK